jgi:hypothetical protein
MLEWTAEHWKTILTVATFLASYPFYRVVKKIVRVSRAALALEICQEDLRLTTGRVTRLTEHLRAAGIDLSPSSPANPPMSSPRKDTNSTDP